MDGRGAVGEAWKEEGSDGAHGYFVAAQESSRRRREGEMKEVVDWLWIEYGGEN